MKAYCDGCEAFLEQEAEGCRGISTHCQCGSAKSRGNYITCQATEDISSSFPVSILRSSFSDAV